MDERRTRRQFPSVESLTDDTVICKCSHITLKEIKAAVNSGAQFHTDVFAQYRLDVRCGQCVDYMNSIIEQLKQNQ